MSHSAVEAAPVLEAVVQDDGPFRDKVVLVAMSRL